MATTLPSTNIKFSQLQSAYGGSNPVSLSEYYRGGSYVDGAVGSPNIPTSGKVSVGDYKNTIAWVRSYLQIGDSNNSLIFGAHTTSGGNASGSLNNYLTTAYTSYGAPYSNPVAQNGGFWISDGTTKIAQVSTGSLVNTWFPLIPTLYGANGTGSTNIGGKSAYALGTGDVSPYADSNTAFCWRHPNSSWTDSMITNMLGFNSTQLSNAKYATTVWWDYALAGMDNVMAGGFAVLSASTFNSSGAQSCWDGRTNIYLHRVTDTGGEWQLQGWTYTPTVTGITLSNTGLAVQTTSYGAFAYYYPAARTWIGATGRAADYDLGTAEEQQTNLRNYWPYDIGTNDLVIPIMKSDNGFSGGAFNGARNPLVARFGYIAAT